MTNPGENLEHVADPGGLPGGTTPAEGGGDEIHVERRRAGEADADAAGDGVPGTGPDSVTSLGNPAGPPD